MGADEGQRKLGIDQIVGAIRISEVLEPRQYEGQLVSWQLLCDLSRCGRGVEGRDVLKPCREQVFCRVECACTGVERMTLGLSEAGRLDQEGPRGIEASCSDVRGKPLGPRFF